MSTIVQVKATTPTSENTQWTVTLDNPVTPGNRMVLIASVTASNAELGVPAGGAETAWTQDGVAEAAAGTHTVEVWSRIAEAGDSTTFTVPHSAGVNRSGQLILVEASDVGAAHDLEVKVATGGTSVTYDNPLDVTSAGQLLLCCHRTTGDDGGAISFPNISAAIPSPTLWQGGVNGGGICGITDDDTDITPNPTWVTARSNLGVAVVYELAGVAPSFTAETPPATAGLHQPYGYSLAADGTPAPTFAVQTGSLPPGIELSSAGVYSGAATTPGQYTHTARATNSVGTDDTDPIVITVPAEGWGYLLT